MSRVPPLSRRSALRNGLAAIAAAGPLLLTGTAVARPAASSRGEQAHRRLRALERAHHARLGVSAVNTRTGARVTYRAAERFPMCSTFKPLAAAAILRDHDHDGTFLDQVVRYTTEELVAHSPITEQHVETGMRVADLCAAAIQYSDNTAANLMLQRIGGPAGVTAFCRSIGDRSTRLDRCETELNTALPGDPRDTTTPAAFGHDYARLVLGDALGRGHRAVLTGWLRGNTTSTEQFRAGLPDGWRVGDKTGGGGYGTTNDVGIAWTGRGTPLVLTVLSTKDTADADPDPELIAETARVLAGALAPHE